MRDYTYVEADQGIFLKITAEWLLTFIVIPGHSKSQEQVHVCPRRHKP